MTRAGVAIVLAAFSLYSAFFGVFSDMIQRGFHLALVIFLVYTGYGAFTKKAPRPHELVIDSVLLIVGFFGAHLPRDLFP